METLGLPIHKLNGANGVAQKVLSNSKEATKCETPVMGSGDGVGAVREMKPQNALQEAARHQTRPLYMDGTYVFHCDAQVILVALKEEDPEVLVVELDQTVFHPQGGGQPSDTGMLMADGLPNLTVAFVCKDKAKVGKRCFFRFSSFPEMISLIFVEMGYHTIGALKNTPYLVEDQGIWFQKKIIPMIIS